MIALIFSCPREENARRAAPALLSVHRAWRWIVMRTAVNFASAEIVRRKFGIGAANKKARFSFEAGLLHSQRAWR